MDLATARAAVANTLDGVEGVNGHTYRPAAPRVGDAWPILPTLELEEGLVWRPTWHVCVFLPQDERAAAMWLDTHFAALVAALRTGDLFAESADLGLITVSGSDQAVLVVTTRGH
ncbi:hypothetical protein [Micromonospora wenchangensis]|uniref:hypothetical protein n=1 Tax=Micromonospora wenchangensis TaxID=1185415 RepID=UPI0037F1025F